MCVLALNLSLSVLTLILSLSDGISLFALLARCRSSSRSMMREEPAAATSDTAASCTADGRKLDEWLPQTRLIQDSSMRCKQANVLLAFCIGALCVHAQVQPCLHMLSQQVLVFIAAHTALHTKCHLNAMLHHL